jgi:hypothetical protein
MSLNHVMPRVIDAPPRWRNAGMVAGCALLLAFYAVLWLSAQAQGDTLFGWRDRVIHDFSVFWGAGRLAAAGRAAAAYDWTQVRAMLEGLFGPPATEVDKTFLYPPPFLLLLAPLGRLPYVPAAAVWLVGTAAAYLAAVRVILPGGTALLAALAAPAVFFNAIAGQNGLLLAGLFGGALVLLAARPILAGILIGMMSFKPQFGPLLPLFLAASGNWRAFAAAAATVAAMFGAAFLVFGAPAFAAFLTASTRFAATMSQPGQEQLHWARLASLYALLRAMGAGPAAAWTAQATLAAGVACAVAAIAAGRAPAALKMAALPVGALLIAPYSELTDLAIATPAMALLLRDGLDRGFAWRDKAGLAAAFILPLVFILLPVRRLFGIDYAAALVGPSMCAVLAAMIGWRLFTVPAKAAVRP